MRRRDFLKLAGASAAGTVLFAGCTIPESDLLLQSPALLPEDLLAGHDQWFATVCRLCPAGCGVIVRVMDGRAKKLEGNPVHPINMGKLCARGQAGVQVVYHPDRVRQPMQRFGPRGLGRFREISWEQAGQELLARLRAAQGQANTVALVTEPLRGHLGMVIDRFVRAYGMQHLAFETLERAPVRAAIQRVFNQERLPDFDIANAKFVLSFGADFLNTWLSPTQYNREYGVFRQGEIGGQGQRRPRGTFVQIEPRLSGTGMNADQWIPVRPGTEGVLALSIAQVIVSEGLGDRAAAQRVFPNAGALDQYRPDRVAGLTGVPADRIVQVARDFAGHRPALALGGGSAAAHTNGTFNLMAIFALNYLVGSVGVNGGVRFNPPPPLQDIPQRVSAASFREWRAFVERMRTGQPQPVNLLLVHQANPVYGLPQAIDVVGAISNVPYIISFSSFIDDTTAYADLIIPDHTYLESWGSDVPDPGPGYPVVSFQQPVVQPFAGTIQFGDLLIRVAQELGGSLAQALPWQTFKEALQQGASELQRLNRGSVREATPQRFWTAVLQRGGWWDPQAPAPQAPAAPQLPTQVPDLAFDGDPREYPFFLIPFPSNALYDGSLAHLPLLQALDDPITTLTWTTWVEVNPQTARELGLKGDQEADVVRVESPFGAVEAVVHVSPSVGPDVVAMPMGQGHRSFFTRYTMLHGRPRGANPLDLVGTREDADTGALAWASTRVRLRKLGRRVRVPIMQGYVQPIQDASWIQVTGPQKA
jgi:anaerobic selenocysteine-containing dehydrogenase